MLEVYIRADYNLIIQHFYCSASNSLKLINSAQLKK